MQATKNPDSETANAAAEGNGAGDGGPVRLETLPPEEQERLRRDATRDAVDRLAAALLDVDASTFAQAPKTPLASFVDRDVDEVTATLLSLADPGTLDEAPPAAADEGVAPEARLAVERLATELLGLYAKGEAGSP